MLLKKKILLYNYTIYENSKATDSKMIEQIKNYMMSSETYIKIVRHNYMKKINYSSGINSQSCVIFRNLAPSYDFLRVKKFGRKIVIFRKNFN